VSDVVFVLDKSTSAQIENQALEMLEQLKAQIEKTDAKVKVGIVIFNKTAHVSSWFNLTSQMSQIKEAIQQEITSGTNSHAGLLAGKELLDNDKEVEAQRKYMVFVSDGITYMYNQEPTVTAWSFENDECFWAGPDNFKLNIVIPS
ncbi:MAG: vWA domain-containing protein, partial [Faecalibacillus sp.]